MGCEIRLRVLDPPRIRISEDEHLRVQYSEYPDYSGPTSVTPSSAAQTLATSGTVLHADVVVAAIPSNYGLITYDGSYITVS
jgi:hypothetical protein